MSLKILSWNIWINGYFDQIADFLKEVGADIIALQEVKDNDPERDIIGYLSSLGYQYASASVRHKHTDSEKVFSHGPAIFSKYPIQGPRAYVLSELKPRIALRADVKIGGETLHVFSTHLVHTHQEQWPEQDEQVTNLIEVLPQKRTILMGDFNAMPDSDVVQKMRKAMVDTDPSSSPTWSVYPEGCEACKPQAVDTRLDYIFTSKDIKTHSFKVHQSKGSDHLPISAVIEI